MAGYAVYLEMDTDDLKVLAAQYRQMIRLLPKQHGSRQNDFTNSVRRSRDQLYAINQILKARSRVNRPLKEFEVAR